MKSRHEARERALQVLYAVEVGEHTPDEACEDLLDGSDPNYLEFVRNLVHLAVAKREEMEGLIGKRAQRWDLERIALVDRLVLRLALCELFFVDDVPPKVTINEAIEIAKEYSTDQSGRFVNGILDAVYNDHEAEIRRGKKLTDRQVTGEATERRTSRDLKTAPNGRKRKRSKT